MPTSDSDRYILIVDGLALSVSTEDLWQLFSPLGSVLSARIVTDAFGKSLGFGYIAMATEEEAAGAVAALHRHSFAGRTISVMRREPAPLNVPPSRRTA